MYLNHIPGIFYNVRSVYTAVKYQPNMTKIPAFTHTSYRQMNERVRLRKQIRWNSHLSYSVRVRKRGGN